MPHMLVPASRAGRFLVFAISISMSLPAVAAAQGHILYGLTSNNTLVRFNSATPGIVETLEISGIADTEVMRAIDFRSLTGQMYGIATDGVGQSVRTYTIDPATGAATTHGSSVVVSAPTPQWGMSFSPVVDRIRIVNSAGESFRINPTTHELAAKDPNLSSPTPPVVDAIAYDRQFAGATQTTLFVIDRATFSLAYQGD